MAHCRSGLSVQSDAISLLPRDWKEWLVGKAIVPVTTGISGTAVLHVASENAAGHYLKIGTGALAEPVISDGGSKERSGLASVGVQVPEITARLIESDVAAALMADLGSRTGQVMTRSIAPQDFAPERP